MTCTQNGILKTILDNTVSITPDFVWSADQRGLSFTNSQCFPTSPWEAVQRIQGNKISGFGNASVKTNTHIVLAYFNNNGAISGPGTIYPTPHILCNDVQNAYEGFVFDGPTNNPSDWRGNTLQDLRYGMTFSNSAVIGQQGNATNPTDNKWLGTWPVGNSNGIWTSFSTATQSPLYINTAAASNVPLNLFGFPPNTSYLFGGTLTATGVYTCGEITLQKSNPGISIRNDFTSNEAFYIYRSFTYRLLAINDSMRLSDGDLNNFYLNLRDSSIGKFKLLEDYIDGEHPEDASSIMSSFDLTSLNTPELTYFDFYQLLLKYRTEPNNVSNDDVLLLQEIGNRCPGIAGPAVFQARALHQTITGQIYPFSADCNFSSGARTANESVQKVSKTLSKEKTSIKLEVFPNPSQNQITIQSDDNFKFNEVQVFDLTHRLCFAKKFEELYTKKELNLDLVNGMYFIKVLNLEKQETLKFCIEK